MAGKSFEKPPKDSQRISACLPNICGMCLVLCMLNDKAEDFGNRGYGSLICYDFKFFERRFKKIF